MAPRLCPFRRFTSLKASFVIAVRNQTRRVSTVLNNASEIYSGDLVSNRSGYCGSAFRTFRIAQTPVERFCAAFSILLRCSLSHFQRTRKDQLLFPIYVVMLVYTTAVHIVLPFNTNCNHNARRDRGFSSAVPFSKFKSYTGWPKNGCH